MLAQRAEVVDEVHGASIGGRWAQLTRPGRPCSGTPPNGVKRWTGTRKASSRHAVRTTNSGVQPCRVLRGPTARRIDVTMTSDPGTSLRSPRAWSAGAVRRGRRRRSQLAMLLLATDAVCVLTVVVPARARAPAVVVFSASALVVHAFAGLYRPRMDLSILDDLPLLVAGASPPSALPPSPTGPSASATSRPAPSGPRSRRPRWCSAPAPSCTPCGSATGGPDASRCAPSSSAAAGWARSSSTSCGPGEHGLLPVGFIDDDPGCRPANVRCPCSEHRRPRTRRAEHRADIVVIAYSNVPEMVVVDVLRSCQGLDVEIFTVPRFWKVTNTHRFVQVGARGAARAAAPTGVPRGDVARSSA